VIDQLPTRSASSAWLSLLLLLAAVGCGPSSREVRLQQERDELRLEVAEINQYNVDLKLRMQLVHARNKVLLDLVQGLTSEPKHGTANSGKGKGTGTVLASADSSLKSLDRDLETLIQSVKQSREDIDVLRDQRSAIQTELAHARRIIEEARVEEAEWKQRVADIRALVAPLVPLIEAGQLEIRVAEGTLTLQLPEDALFTRDARGVSTSGKTLLDRIADDLSAARDRQFRVSGPIDYLPEGAESLPKQWRLSSGRAIDVLMYLIQRGVPRRSLSVATQAVPPPVKETGTRRTVEIALIPRAQDLPRWPTREQLIEPQQPTAADPPAGPAGDSVAEPADAVTPTE
jgi:chemotaxis protein MotB